MAGIDAMHAATALADSGHISVHLLDRGLAGWVSAGGPVASGPCCIPPGISCAAPLRPTNASLPAACDALESASPHRHHRPGPIRP